MSEVMQPKPIKYLMRWIIAFGALLLIALVFGSVPVLISYRKG